jgi:hypothetical protein
MSKTKKALVIGNGSHMPKRQINDLIASLDW